MPAPAAAAGPSRTIGKYHPKADPSVIEIDSDRAQYWLGVGAQPTESVLSLLKVTGDWQKFQGLPGAEGTLQGQKPRPDRKALYEAALAAAGGEDAPAATTPRRRGADRAERPTERSGERPAERPAEPAAAERTAEPAAAERPAEPAADAPAS